jgi:hypothetical protein|tara:strand:- start:146 stop:631 length:486 start_codon:yes stop_codon:yes gene_type:complete
MGIKIQQVVLDKLFQNRTELSKEVKLSLKSDVENAISALSGYDSSQSDLDKVVDIAKNFNSLLEQIRPIARDFISEYESLKSSNNNLNNDTIDLKESIFEYQNGLRELGLDDMSDEVREYYDILNKYEVLDSVIYNYNYEQENLVGVDFISLLSWANDIEN